MLLPRGYKLHISGLFFVNIYFCFDIFEGFNILVLKRTDLLLSALEYQIKIKSAIMYSDSESITDEINLREKLSSQCK